MRLASKIFLTGVLVITGDREGAELARTITGTVDNLGAVVNEITAFGRTPELRRTPRGPG